MSEDEFEHYDGAYVLGALSATDRHRFEAHLQNCDDCVERVAQLQGLPRLLELAPESAFTGDRFVAEGSASGVDVGVPAGAPDLLPRLLADVRVGRRRRRILDVAGLLAVAAAVVALLAVLLTSGTSTDPDRAPAQARAMTNLVPIEMVASVQIVRHSSWDQVNLWCTYRAHESPPSGGNYLAVAVDRAGRREVIGSWPVVPGQTAVIRTPTAFRAGQVASVEVTSAKGVTLAHVKI